MVDGFWRLACETADVVCDQSVSRCCVRSLVQSAYSRSCVRLVNEEEFAYGWSVAVYKRVFRYD